MSRWTSPELGQVVEEASRCLRDDAGRLWGSTAEPRWIIVDDDVWWLTQPDDEANPAGELWTYAADPHTATANTAVHWHDRDWAMVDNGDELPTAQLLLHEAFHAFWQPRDWDWVTPWDAGDDSLSRPAPCAALVVELGVWADALESGDRELASAARTIRDWRLDQLTTDERRRQDYLDLWEGLAEYSACRWTGTDTGKIAQLARRRPDLGSWYRSFCYSTGPVIGYVLDLVDPGWQHRLKAAGSISSMISNAVPELGDPVDALLERFGYPQLLIAAEAAHDAWEAEDQKLRDQFATALWVPNRSSIVFDPHGARRWDVGTYYRSVTIRASELRVDADAAVVSENWRWVGLPSAQSYDPEALTAEGPGWQLTSTRPLRDHGIVSAPRPPAGVALPEV